MAVTVQEIIEEEIKKISIELYEEEDMYARDYRIKLLYKEQVLSEDSLRVESKL